MDILVTGAFGWTAAPTVYALHIEGHSIVGLDLQDVVCPPLLKPYLSKAVECDVADYEAVYDAMNSADAVIHFAIAVGEDDYKNPDVPFATNVRGTYNVFEAARRREVDKVVMISSADVHFDSTDQDHSDWRSSPDSDHVYDLTKRLQEEIAKDFVDTFGMTTVVLRAGHIVDGHDNVDSKGRPLEILDYCKGGWVSKYDLANACIKALELEQTGYSMYHVIGSTEAYGPFDVAKTERELGLIFESRFEEYRQEG